MIEGRGDLTSRSATALVLEASTYRASVAVICGTTVLATREVAMGSSADDRLMPTTAVVLAEAGVGVSDLAYVVCGAGPGSFTSLRIAAALAKGLITAFDNGPVLASVPSPLLVVAAAAEGLSAGSYLVSLDALRGERYAALVVLEPIGSGKIAGPSGLRLRTVGATSRLSVAAVAAWARDAEATLIGPGCDINAWPEARGAVWIWDSARPVDVASWEPEYGRMAEAEVRREEHDRSTTQQPLAGPAGAAPSSRGGALG